MDIQNFLFQFGKTFTPNEKILVFYDLQFEYIINELEGQVLGQFPLYQVVFTKVKKWNGGNQDSKIGNTCSINNSSCCGGNSCNKDNNSNEISANNNDSNGDSNGSTRVGDDSANNNNISNENTKPSNQLNGRSFGLLEGTTLADYIFLCICHYISKSKVRSIYENRYRRRGRYSNKSYDY